MGGRHVSREHDPELKDRVRRLLGFLRELVATRSSPVLDVDRHEDVLWLAEAEAAALVDTAASAGEVVLRAPRTTLAPAPQVPLVLKPWLSLSDAARSGRTPELRELGPAEDGREVARDAPEAEHVRRELLAWLPQWRAWAALDRQRRPRFDAYQALQLALQEMTARPESVELVVAAGLLTLQDGSTRVRTHLVSQPAVVEKEPLSGDLVCRLVPGSSPRLEDSQLLTGRPVFDPSGSPVLQTTLTEHCTGPQDPALPAVLKEWAQRALSTTLDVSDDRSPRADRAASLVPAPALVLRRRSAFALVEYYEAMIASIEDGATPVPLGLAQLVEAIEPEERTAWLDRAGASGAVDLSDDPLFPLPANGEQREILSRLGRDSGVVVEGPPGTGKTHTIANLVSALLAEGQRVLVTSEKSQALRVLREKLPPEMQELCISITDVARGGSAELNRSVATLAARRSGFQPRAADNEIDDLTSRRRDARSERARLLEQVGALRESETVVHPPVAPGYAGTAAAVVRAVLEGRPRHEWLPRSLRTASPTLTPDRLRRLVELERNATPAWRDRPDQVFPDLAGLLPSDTDLAATCQAATTPHHDPDDQLAGRLDGLTPEALQELAAACRHVEDAADDIAQSELWVHTAAGSLLGGRAAVLWQRLDELENYVDGAIAADGAVGPADVRAAAPPSAALPVLDAWARYLRDGGQPRRLRKAPEQKAVEALAGEVTVDGAPVTSARAAAAAANHFRALDAVRTAAALASPLAIPVSTTGSRPQQVNELDQVRHGVRRARTMHRACQNVLAVAARQGVRLGPITDVEQARAVARSAAGITERVRSGQAQDRLDETARRVQAAHAGGPSPESAQLVTALHAADVEGVVEARSALAVARREQAAHAEQQELRGTLFDGCGELPTLVAAHADDPDWDERWRSLDEAWSWRTAATWVEQRSTPGLEQELDRQVAATEADISRLTASLAAAQAWRSCLQRMTAGQVQALQSYRDATTNIGKGTGKYAERFGAAARSAMHEAQGAVPAWVMPLRQVLASIPPQPNSFDVVIVDEASQADISSLFLLWLAPRVIVVGDDKQCTPSEVTGGVLDDVFTRLESYLPDMPSYLRASLTPRSSVFSLLRTRFGQVVRLREHFRCMPEIITWSSLQFYEDAPLVPVRQFGADRLPPLRTSYVEDAHNEGRGSGIVNRAEAAAIVEAVTAALRDPAYDGKTFGVVVLQGQAQADLIRTELIGALTQDDFDERRLRVGTPPDFQGDERHVVILSMVLAPGHRTTSLTSTEQQRRYNVAASRAQDQLWLFHSVATDHLGAADLRRSLLQYMTTTSPAPADPMPTGVSADQRHREFDTLFEQQVFLDIQARGYHVTPQVEVNNRRLDLVVTGAAAKLAVECDGEARHSTPEQRQSDLDRELELRRCGWEFWRLRESTYYLDPARALLALWSLLEARGIGPLVVSADVPAVSRPPWTPTTLPDDDVHTDIDTGTGTGTDVLQDAQVVEPQPTASSPAATEPRVAPQEEAAHGPVAQTSPDAVAADPDADDAGLAAAIHRSLQTSSLTAEQAASLHGITIARAAELLGRLVTDDRAKQRGPVHEPFFQDRHAPESFERRRPRTARSPRPVPVEPPVPKTSPDPPALRPETAAPLLDPPALRPAAPTALFDAPARPDTPTLFDPEPDRPAPLHSDTPPDDAGPPQPAAAVSAEPAARSIDISALQAAVLDGAARGPVTISMMMAISGAGETAVRAALHNLVRAGELVQTRGPSGSTYRRRPSSRVAAPTPSRRAPSPPPAPLARLTPASFGAAKQVLSAAAAQGPVTVGDACSITGRPPVEAKRILVELVADGVLARRDTETGPVFRRRRG